MTMNYLFVKYEDATTVTVPWNPHLNLFLGNGGFKAPSEENFGVTVYRDDLRHGWHVVPAGVRYVAVRGAVAGQWASPVSDNSAAIAAGDIDGFNSGMFGREHGDVYTLAHPDWLVIIDLHNLGPADHRAPSKAPESPRYAVKAASEMQHGEPCARLVGWTRDDAQSVVDGTACDRPVKGGYRAPGDLCFTVWHAGAVEGFVIVDTKDAWHTLARNTTIVMGDTWAADSPRAARLRKAPPPSPAPVKAEPVGPTRPSDERICAEWGIVMHWFEAGEPGVSCPNPHYQWDEPGARGVCSVMVDGVKTNRADYRKARTAVLAAKVQASAERERLTVLGPIDHWEHA